MPSVMESKLISGRIIVIRVRAKPGNIATVQMYAPTLSSSEDDIESFYEKLEDTVKNSNKRDHKINQGDWNCQIGGDAKRIWPDTAGSFGVGMKNERGVLALHLQMLRLGDYLPSFLNKTPGKDDHRIVAYVSRSSTEVEQSYS